MQQAPRQDWADTTRRGALAVVVFAIAHWGCAADVRHDAAAPTHQSAQSEVEAGTIAHDEDDDGGAASSTSSESEPDGVPPTVSEDASAPGVPAADAAVSAASLDASADISDASSAPSDSGDPRVCTFTFTQGQSGESVTCRLAPETVRACEAAIRCMCEAGVAPLGPRDSDVQRCVDRWLIPRGGLTLVDFCRTASAPDVVSVARALKDLALAYQGKLVASSACEQVRATY
jgi:hypothetical protein